MEYLVNAWNGFITGNTLYEIGSGQEPRRDFAYIEVPAGTGQYAWIDYNNDGIPQLNEFVIALFADQAKYIRVYTPSSQYVKANYTQLNYSITLSPRSLIKNSANKNFIGRFNLQSAMQTFKKAISSGKLLFSPFKGSVQDTSLLNVNFTLSNTLSFNRYSAAWGIDITNLINNSKTLLTYGTESRQQNQWTVHGRINFARAYSFELIQKTGTNNLFTPAFGNQKLCTERVFRQSRSLPISQAQNSELLQDMNIPAKPTRFYMATSAPTAMH